MTITQEQYEELQDNYQELLEDIEDLSQHIDAMLNTLESAKDALAVLVAHHSKMAVFLTSQEA